MKIHFTIPIVVISLVLMAPTIIDYIGRYDVLIGINNQSGIAVNSIQVSKTDSSSYTSNMLTEPLLSKQTIKITSAGNDCLRDVKVTYANNEVQVLQKLNGCYSLDTVLSQKLEIKDEVSKNPSFNLINNSKTSSIVELYIASVNDSWAGNRLSKGNEITPGTSYSIFLPKKQCMYNIKITFDNQEVSERLNVDTCSITFMALP